LQQNGRTRDEKSRFREGHIKDYYVNAAFICAVFSINISFLFSLPKNKAILKNEKERASEKEQL
jgi:hypothetical protein